MKKLLVVIALAGMFGCGDGVSLDIVQPTANGCIITVTGNGNNSSCRDGNQTNVTASPSPTPGAGPQDCRVDYLSGSGPDYLPMNAEAEYSLTPMQQFVDANGASQVRPVPDACNEPKADQVSWVAGDPRILQVVVGHFSAKVKRTATGLTNLTVSFDGKSKVFQIN